MSNTHSTLTSLFSDIANAIRGKTGESAQLIADEFPEAIAAIPSGGSDPVISPLPVTENGTYTAPSGVDGYSPVIVNVPTVDPIPASVSGYTEFDIFVSKVTGLTIPCNMVGEKDWGDGSPLDSLTEHTYSEYGLYTITCKGTAIPAGSSSSGGVFNTNSSSTTRGICLALRVGNSVTTIGQYAMYYCQSLIYVHLPDSVTSIGVTAFRNCTALDRIRLSQNVTSLAGNVFYSCYSLKKINTDAVRTVAGAVFQNCYSLENVNVNSLNGISAALFHTCYCMKEYDFRNRTAIVPLSATTAFQGINPACKIVVPDSLYDDWVAATNWSTYADYIYKASEV